MKPVLDLKYTILLTAGLWSTLMLTGCSLTDRIPGSKQLKELIPGGRRNSDSNRGRPNRPQWDELPQSRKRWPGHRP